MIVPERTSPKRRPRTPPEKAERLHTSVPYLLLLVAVIDFGMVCGSEVALDACAIL